MLILHHCQRVINHWFFRLRVSKICSPVTEYTVLLVDGLRLIEHRTWLGIWLKLKGKLHVIGYFNFPLRVSLYISINPKATVSRDAQHSLGLIAITPTKSISHNKLSYPRARSAIPCFIEHSVQLFEKERYIECHSSQDRPISQRLIAGSQQSLLVSAGLIDRTDKLGISRWCHCVPSSLNGGHYMITDRHGETR